MKLDEMTWEDLCAFFAMHGFLAGNYKTDAQSVDEHFKNISAASYALAEDMKIEREKDE
jgi:hypothetical protein